MWFFHVFPIPLCRQLREFWPMPKLIAVRHILCLLFKLTPVRASVSHSRKGVWFRNEISERELTDSHHLGLATTLVHEQTTFWSGFSVHNYPPLTYMPGRRNPRVHHPESSFNSTFHASLGVYFRLSEVVWCGGCTGLAVIWVEVGTNQGSGKIKLI